METFMQMKNKLMKKFTSIATISSVTEAIPETIAETTST